MPKKKNKTGLNSKVNRRAEKYKNGYDSNKWDKKYFDRKTGGFVVASKDRVKQSGLSKNERLKYEKELYSCKVFAKNGYSMELREGKGKGNTYDVKINGVKADLKSVSNANNIMKYAKKAINRQGASRVLFEVDNKLTPSIKREFNKLNTKGIKGYYYERGKNKVHPF
jgi:hypothetical protein